MKCKCGFAKRIAAFSEKDKTFSLKERILLDTMLSAFSGLFTYICSIKSKTVFYAEDL